METYDDQPVYFGYRVQCSHIDEHGARCTTLVRVHDGNVRWPRCARHRWQSGAACAVVLPRPKSNPPMTEHANA